MTDYGLRISQDGVDVKTEDDEKMVITSKYPVLKGSLSGGGTTIVFSGVPKTITISHGFGYIPICFANVDNGAGYWWAVPYGADGPLGYSYSSCYADDENFYIIFDFAHATLPSTPQTYKYFIYLDKAKL